MNPKPISSPRLLLTAPACSLFFFAATPLPLPALAADILFIGHSYTGQIKQTLTALVAASPHADTKLTFIHPGGKTLEFHSTYKKSLEAIETGDHSHVVLQDQSQTPALLPKKFLAASAELAAKISAKGAKPVYYLTWGRQNGDKRNSERFPTFTAMQDALTESYTAAAERDDALLARVGEAFRIVHAEKPELFKKLYKGDASHPAPHGAYLAACCFYATLFDADPTELTFTASLPEPDTTYLRAVAQRTSQPTRR